MVSFDKPSAKNVLNELDIQSYLPTGKDRKDIVAAARLTLKSMEDNPNDYRLHVENVHKFMKALWSKYDCEEVFQILDRLTRIEPALLDLARDPEAGKRYRDHYVHLFHVFVFGLRILSSIIQKVGSDQASKILKVKDEQFGGKIHGRNVDGEEVEFHDYPWKERMFYLWTLISTLHDIAVPITHLDKIREALNEFSDKFHLEISGPILVPSFPAGLEAYLHLVSSLFEGRFEPAPSGGWRYKKEPSGAYIKGYFERFVSKNHGVLGGFLSYKMIEEIFLQGKSQKYKLDTESFQSYKELVLEEDVARATLAICLHDLKYDDDYFAYPRFMPLSFDHYPLTFILIIADSLQEYLRWEGMSIRGDTKLYGFPAVKLSVEDDRFIVECFLSVTEVVSEQAYFCNEVKRMTNAKGWTSTGNTVRHAANDFYRLLADDIEKKLYLGDRASDRFTLRLHFFEGNAHLCSHTFRTERS